MKEMRSRQAGREEGRAFIDSKPRVLLTGVFFLCEHEHHYLLDLLFSNHSEPRRLKEVYFI